MLFSKLIFRHFPWFCGVLVTLTMILAGCDSVNVGRQADGGSNPQSVAIRINAGGDSYTDTAGRTWLADTGFNTGRTSADGLGVDITATTDDLLYQVQRWDPSSGDDLIYSIAVPNGTYTLRLHFAETFPANTAIGDRVFDVFVEDNLVLDNLDIIEQVGAQNRALVRQIPGISVSDGNLTLQFGHVVDNPTIAAIEVLFSAPAQDTNPPTVPTNLTAYAGKSQVTLNWSPSFDDEGQVIAYNVYRDGVKVATTNAVTYTDTGLDPETVYSYGVSAIDNALPANESGRALIAVQTLEATASAVVRINAGGDQLVDSEGQVWQADSGFNSDSTDTSDVSDDILGTVDDRLYQTQRWDRPGNPRLTYSFAVPNGEYAVRFLLAETFSGNFAVGARVFDVRIEGVTVLSDIDIFQAVGGFSAYEETTGTVTISDGVMNIEFMPGVENPTVAAIEVIALTASGGAVPTTPANLTAVEVTSDFVELGWLASSDSDGVVAGYRVYRDSIPIGITLTTSFTDSGVSPGVNYSYQVSALDDDTPSNESALTAPLAVFTPATASAFRVNVGGADYTDADGNLWIIDYGYCNQGNVVADGVGKEIDNTELDRLYQTQRESRVSPAVMSCAFNLAPGDYDVRLHFAEIVSTKFATGQRVFEVQLEGNTVLNGFDVYQEAGGENRALVETFYNIPVNDGSLNMDFTGITDRPMLAAIEIVGLSNFADTVAPTVPTNLAVVAGNSRVTLTWNASSDTTGSVAYYRVSRDSVQIAVVRDTTFTDNLRTPGTSYTYEVTAVDNAIPSNESAPASVVATTTNNPDTTGPTTPQNLRAEALQQEIYLSWLDSTDTQGDVVGYSIIRDGSIQGSVADSYFVDTGLTPNTSYDYEVIALDYNGNPSLPSATLTVTTLPSGTVVVERVNSGGPAYTDTLGNVWSADKNFNNASRVSSDGFGQDTAGTGDDLLYQTQRWIQSYTTPVRYSFPGLASGNYTVRLHFSEDFDGSPAGATPVVPSNFAVNQRVFDINVEGNPVLDYDIFAAAGAGLHKVVEEFTNISVNDGTLNIVLSAKPEIEDKNYPTISAIEIFQLP